MDVEDSKTATRLCSKLGPILDGLRTNDPIPESESFRDVLVGLEFYIPRVLREVHPEWRDESLDGIFPAVAQKTADREIELIGFCILISDQTLTPFRLNMQLEESVDDVAWLECWLGENTDTGMMRIPYSGNWSKMLVILQDRVDVVDWTYHVGFGDRPS